MLTGDTWPLEARLSWLRGVLVGQNADPQPSHDRTEMVTAGAPDSDGPNDHQLVEVAHVGKLSDGGARHISATEHFLQIHLGHTACCVAGVVVINGVDYKAVEYAFHLDLDLVEQLFQLARFYKLGDVVIGMETFACGLDAFPDLDRNGCSLIGISCVHGALLLH
mgnify:CR=1 FL=1